MKNFDNSFLNAEIKLVAGTDEAGRGPLAGPVVAAAVIFSPDIFLENVNDSKKLTEHEREQLFPLIKKHALAYGISVISNARIDKINILQASLLAMKRSVDKLKIKPDLILIDGNRAFKHDVPTIAIVKGDSKSFSVAAASILAKVTRDRIMKKLCKEYPQFLWSKNKGYPTQEHINTLKIFGPTELHRKSFLHNILEEERESNFKTNYETE